MRINSFLLLIGLSLGLFANAQINPVAPKNNDQIGIYEHLDEFILDDIQLIDKDSAFVNLKSLIDKPTVFAFIYSLSGLIPRGLPRDKINIFF